jgi:hypothetical protein
MEKNMEQIYREEFLHGSHTIYGEYDGHGDLTLSSFHFGSDVEESWGNDEYEYYLTIDKKGLPKFLLKFLSKSFNTEEQLTLDDLQKICDDEGIKYSTDSWV